MFTEDDVMEMYRNSLKMDDTFNFECKMCGDCCRKRKEPIIISGLDAFYIAKALDMEMPALFNKILNVEVGYTSKMPTVYLQERLDGSCRLLRNGRCMVQDNKPIVCRLYPIGRLFNGKEFVYFNQHSSCGGKETPITLREWLNAFNIPEDDIEGKTYMKVFGEATLYMQTLKKETDKQEFYKDLFLAFFIQYDIEKSFLENFNENKAFLYKKYPKMKLD